jgi:hypothetical protein
MKPACKRGDVPTKAYRAESRGREANTMKAGRTMGRRYWGFPIEFWPTLS